MEAVRNSFLSRRPEPRCVARGIAPAALQALSALVLLGALLAQAAPAASVPAQGASAASAFANAASAATQASSDAASSVSNASSTAQGPQSGVAGSAPGAQALAKAAPTSAAASAAAAKACTEDSVVAALQIAKAADPAIPQVRIASRMGAWPLGKTAEILAFTPLESKSRYRVFLEKAHDPSIATLIDSDQIWAEEATLGEGGTDFAQKTSKTRKTLIHFTPELDTPGVWENARALVFSCLEGRPQFYGQISTTLTNVWICRILAILLCVIFYVLAVFATFYVRQAHRKYSTDELIARNRLTGTNYATLREHFNPVVLTAGANGRGSATKLQILFFSLTVFGLVSYIWMSTGYLSDLSSTVLLLMGISGLGATVSAATDVSKNRLDFDNWAWLMRRRWLPIGGVAEANRAQWKDIVTTDGEFDVYRFQMVTFSVLVALALLGAGGQSGDLSTFTIPAALLGILGLSQVVYVAGKLVAPPSIVELNAQITKLRTAESNLQTALTQHEPGATPGGVVTLPRNAADLKARVGDAYEKYIEAWETAKTMFESTLSREVSAVAEGYRPPFPYLMAPADVKAALEADHAEIAARLVSSTAALGVAPFTGQEAAKRLLERVAQARAAYEEALANVTKTLEGFAKATETSSKVDLEPDSDNAAAKTLATQETMARAALATLAQRIDEMKDQEAAIQKLLATPPVA